MVYPSHPIQVREGFYEIWFHTECSIAQPHIPSDLKKVLLFSGTFLTHPPEKAGWRAYYLHDRINLTCRNGWGTPGWGKLQHLCQIRFWSEDLLRWLIEDHKHVLVHSLGFFDPKNVDKKKQKNVTQYVRTKWKTLSNASFMSSQTDSLTLSTIRLLSRDQAAGSLD